MISQHDEKLEVSDLWLWIVCELYLNNKAVSPKTLGQDLGFLSTRKE